MQSKTKTILSALAVFMMLSVAFAIVSTSEDVSADNNISALNGTTVNVDGGYDLSNYTDIENIRLSVDKTKALIYTHTAPLVSDYAFMSGKNICVLSIDDDDLDGQTNIAPTLSEAQSYSNGYLSTSLNWGDGSPMTFILIPVCPGDTVWMGGYNYNFSSMTGSHAIGFNFYGGTTADTVSNVGDNNNFASGITIPDGVTTLGIFVPKTEENYCDYYIKILSAYRGTQIMAKDTTSDFTVSAYDGTNTSTVTLHPTAVGHKVAFNSNGGTAVGTQIAGTTATRPTDPTRAGGYTFNNWYSDSELTTVYDFSSTVSADTTLYAKWNEPEGYSVTFNANGGSPTPTTQFIQTGGTATQPTAPTKTDYTFAGWYKDSALTTAYVWTTPVTQNITLYAKWIGSGTYHDSNNNEYAVSNGTLTISKASGTGSMATFTADANVSSILGGEAFNRVVINNGMTSIGAYAFNNATNITSVVIPTSVVSFGNYAFYGCSALTEIDLPIVSTTYSSFGQYVFAHSGLTSLYLAASGGTWLTNATYLVEGCSSLTSITLPSGTYSVPTGMCKDCTSLTSITIPSGVTNLAANSLMGCTSLKTVYVEGTTVKTLTNGYSTFTTPLQIFVPLDLVSSYRTSWSGYSQYIVGYVSNSTLSGYTAVQGGFLILEPNDYYTISTNTYIIGNTSLLAPYSTELLNASVTSGITTLRLIDTTNQKYTDYTVVITDREKIDYDMIQEEYGDKLFSAIGDSITKAPNYVWTETTVWWAVLGTDWDMTKDVIFGQGSTAVNGSYFLGNVDDLQASGLSAPDVIFFMGGVNDASLGYTMTPFDSSASYVTTLEDLTLTSFDSYTEAYCQLILRAQHYYPNAQIIILNEADAKNKTLAVNEERRTITKDIADYYGLLCVNLNNSGAPYYDTVHPTEAGQTDYADYISHCMTADLIGDKTSALSSTVGTPVTYTMRNYNGQFAYYVVDPTVASVSMTGNVLTITPLKAGTTAIKTTETSYGNIETINFTGIVNYTVTFDSNGGTDVASQIVTSGSVATQPTTNPTKTGYSFGGWYANEGLTTEYVWTTPITADTTIYAKWNINTFTVSFNSDGGSSVASQTVSYGQKATAPVDPTKSGYTFDGWYNGDTKYDFNTTVTSDLALKAQWKANAATTADSTTKTDESKNILDMPIVLIGIAVAIVAFILSAFYDMRLIIVTIAGVAVAVIAYFVL